MTKSTGVALSLFLVFFLFVFNASAGYEIDQTFYNSNFTLNLNKDGSYHTTDSTLVSSNNGNWNRSKKQLTFTYATSDSTTQSKSFLITYSTKNRISLKSDKKLFTFKTKTPEQHSIFVSIGRGALGIIFLIFIGWLLSADRKNINWSGH
ncbi:MAG: hypothetical protein MK066_06745 [Crocinitomicaceae bacterium]|nr:hypothetical protein [Crocinitomicaceae bacterium]